MTIIKFLIGFGIGVIIGRILWVHILEKLCFPKNKEDKMNLKNKTDKELWDMLDTILYPIKRFKGDQEDKYDIHQEIIRREKDNERKNIL